MCRLFIAVFLCILSLSVSGGTLPKWEAGVALVGQSLRDYRGSKESQLNAYPVPYVNYRGDFLKADRNGVRGEFLANNRFEVNLSGEAALNGSSDDNSLRKGMPELDSAFELGPSFNINLTGEDFGQGWQLRLPVRGVISVGEAGVHHRGYNFNPRLTHLASNVLWGWDTKFNLGVLYATREYHDYYYSVDQQYVTTDRPFYQARGGFSGYYGKVSIRRRFGNKWMGFSLRYDNLSGATFEDSPLVETNHYVAFSFAVAWVAWQGD